MKFKDFVLNEEATKNLKLSHLEDQIIDRGMVGAKDSILFLRSLRDMLQGHVSSSASALVYEKFDGAPAIVAGINPENGKFFVGTKAVFNKKTPKINYTNEDIDINHADNAYLRKVLKLALQYLPPLGITNPLQGDIMFTRDDLSIKPIDGQSYLTFKPNTIVYAVPEKSDLANAMRRALFGIVFHTRYVGDTIKDMEAVIGFNAIELNPSIDVWYRDAAFVDASGLATLTQPEYDALNALLTHAGGVYSALYPEVVNYISQSDTYKKHFHGFYNDLIRNGHHLSPAELAVSFQHYVLDKLNDSLIDAKLEKTKMKRASEKTSYVRFFKANFPMIVLIFTFIDYIVQAKAIIVAKLSMVKNLGTFIETEDGFKVTSPEGFVAVDHLNNAIKLVDRFTFSRENFKTTRNWDNND